MKKVIHVLLTLNLFLLSDNKANPSSNSTIGDTVVQTLKKATGVPLNQASDQLFVDIVQEKKNQLQKLLEEQTAHLAAKNENIQKITEQTEEVENHIHKLERSLQHYTHNKYLNKQLFLMKEMHQVLKDIHRSMDDATVLFDTLINSFTEFVRDPEHKAFKDERHLEERMAYSFDNLRRIDEMIVNQERFVAQLAEQEKNIQVEQESRKRMLKIIEEDHAKRLEDLQNFAEHYVKSDHYDSLSIEQQEKELIETEEKLFRYKKNLYELRIQENKYGFDLVQLKLITERFHLDILRHYIKNVRSAIKVSEPDLIYAREYLNSQRKTYYARRERYQQDRDRLTHEQKAKERFRDIFSKENHIALGRDIDEWNRDPKQTITSYQTLIELSTLNAEVLWLAKERDLLETQRALEDEKFNYMVAQTNIKETFFKINARKLTSTEDITQVLKKFETHRVDAASTLAIYKERINTVADLLNQQKKVLDNITFWQEERLKKQQDFIFKGHQTEYIHILEQLHKGKEFIKKRIDVLGKLTGVYSGIISEVNATLRLLQFIIAELQSVTIWYRPEYAITFQGVKNIIPDIITFFKDIKNYLLRFEMNSFTNVTKDIAQTPWTLFLFIVKLLISLLLLLNLYLILPSFFTFLGQNAKKTGSNLMSFFLHFAALFFEYIYEYFIFVGWWFFIAFILSFWITDPYIYTIFCLLSIPYLILLSYKFIQFVVIFNIRNDYLLISSEFQSRFVIIFSTLLYATIAIFFFRHGFMRISYYSTELPTVLLAINFIIFQITLIFLITKDQILSIIPQTNDLWLWVSEQVNNYFYFILIFFVTIIVMSNPYVGFGRLVLYILFGLFYTLTLLRILILLYRWSKKTASELFFIEDEEVVRERFDHARTWFGLCIIVSFFSISFLGSIIGAKIWGWHFGLQDIIGLARKPILLESTTYPITMFSILQIIAFILLGFVVAYCANRFVLDKIFELLVVDPGVQYTTTRFIQYFIMIIFIFFGFKNVGLGDLVGYLIGAIAIGIGWYVREPIGDFIAYFIILVQRPLKIGDFIKLDNETFGFVRKITPRAVIIRKKNSTTIVIPNAHIINRSIANWNYVRNYIAFDDIFIIVPYKEDPQKVKDLLTQSVTMHPNILRNPKPVIRLEDFNEFGYLFLVRGFISSAFTQDMWDIASDVRLVIAKNLKDNDIEIADYWKLIKSLNMTKNSSQN